MFKIDNETNDVKKIEKKNFFENFRKFQAILLIIDPITSSISTFNQPVDGHSSLLQFLYFVTRRSFWFSITYLETKTGEHWTMCFWPKKP